MKRILKALIILSLTHTAIAVAQPPATDRLKILVAVWNFPRLSETFVVNQIIGLLSQGHEVKILALNYKGQREPVLNKDIITYKLKDLVIKKVPSDLASYDVIISQFGNIGLEIEPHLKKLKGKKPKHITFFRGYDISSFLTKWPGAYTKFLKSGDLFVAECDFFKQRLISLGASPEKCAVHYSSIQTSRFQYKTPQIAKDGIVKIITVSRLVEKKGIEDSLYAMQKVMAAHPKVRYTIIGDGPLKARLINLTHQLGIAQKVTFAGYLEPQAVAEALNSHHIFVLPCVVATNNNIDGVPTVLKEAMACGLPVVSTFVSGIPEIIENGKSGYLVQPHDSAALTEKLSYLISHPELWEPMGRAGRVFVENKCDINVLNSELEAILYKIVEKNK